MAYSRVIQIFPGFKQLRLKSSGPCHSKRQENGLRSGYNSLSWRKISAVAAYFQQWRKACQQAKALQVSLPTAFSLCVLIILHKRTAFHFPFCQGNCLKHVGKEKGKTLSFIQRVSPGRGCVCKIVSKTKQQIVVKLRRKFKHTG